MAQNPTITQLDPNQIPRRTFDESNDAIRFVSADTSGFAIELSAADGDNLAVLGLSASQKVSLTSSSTGVVVPAFDCSGYKSFNLYASTTSTIVGAQLCTLEVSPSDTDNVWVATSLTVTPSLVNGTLVMGTAVSNIVARRARVSIAAAITSGTFDLYALKQGN